MLCHDKDDSQLMTLGVLVLEMQWKWVWVQQALQRGI